MDTEPVDLSVITSRMSDRDATVRVGRRGTGLYIQLRFQGNRGGERFEQVGLTDGMRRRLIIALGGQPT